MEWVSVYVVKPRAIVLLYLAQPDGDPSAGHVG